jgi:DinB superfamily
MPEFQFTIAEPTTKAELLAELRRLHEASTVFWEAFRTEEFFTPVGNGWSPAGNVRHLNKSIAPLGRALRLPRVLLWILFGTSTKPSRPYAGVIAEYRAATEQGGGAGSYAPEPANVLGNDARQRVELMSRRQELTEQFWSAVESWRDADLDRYRLPHPLMGKVTLREMLFFSLYHNYHHARSVATRLQSVASASAS